MVYIYFHQASFHDFCEMSQSKQKKDMIWGLGLCFLHWHIFYLRHVYLWIVSPHEFLDIWKIWDMFTWDMFVWDMFISDMFAWGRFIYKICLLEISLLEIGLLEKCLFEICLHEICLLDISQVILWKVIIIFPYV